MLSPNLIRQSKSAFIGTMASLLPLFKQHQEIDVFTLFSALTLDMFGSAFLSKNFQLSLQHLTHSNFQPDFLLQSEETYGLKLDIFDDLHVLGKAVYNRAAAPKWSWNWFLKDHLDLERSKTRVKTFLRQLVDEKLDQEGEAVDLIDHMLEAMKKDGTLVSDISRL